MSRYTPPSPEHRHAKAELRTLRRLAAGHIELPETGTGETYVDLPRASRRRLAYRPREGR